MRVTLAPFFKLLDHHGGRVRNLFLRRHQDLLADDFCHHETDGLVGDLVFGKIARTFWQEPEHLFQQHIEAFFFRAESGMISRKSWSFRYSSMMGSSFSLVPRRRSILFSSRKTGVPDFFAISSTKLSSRVNRRVTSTISRTNSQPTIASRTSAIIFRPSEVSGR